MGATIKIHVVDPSIEIDTHRFRNFGEDIFRALHETCSVDLEEIDRATNEFFIREIPRRHLGVVTKRIKHELKHHHLEDAVTLARV